MPPAVVCPPGAAGFFQSEQRLARNGQVSGIDHLGGDDPIEGRCQHGIGRGNAGGSESGLRLAHPLAGRFLHVFRLGERGPRLAEAGIDLFEFLAADRFLVEHHPVALVGSGRKLGTGRRSLARRPCGLLGLAGFSESRLSLPPLGAHLTLVDGQQNPPALQAVAFLHGYRG